MHHDMAILSLVGKQMRNMVGIAGRMFTTLAQGNVNIEMISQGASEINISCVIESRDAVKALNLIHQSCLQIRPDGARGRCLLLLLGLQNLGAEFGIFSWSLVVLKKESKRYRYTCISSSIYWAAFIPYICMSLNLITL